ncbi:MAG TPA: hypothetical protein VLF18_06520 [Tahibacter sp.]|uniref:hypothetical protein n=1 Tax=Tahibacter sp. TaxID=2056211 RepID=UPI002CBDA9AB|nr:hypothetical protein [Tahibacter sp.]HSX59835.1 hypothetical protein [Tahibacter sp.]
MTPTPRPAREWLRDTYWYCPAADMPALRTEATGVFAWVVDQTVWHVTGGADGYFWGVASTLLTPAGDTPDASQKKRFDVLREHHARRRRPHHLRALVRGDDDRHRLPARRGRPCAVRHADVVGTG